MPVAFDLRDALSAPEFVDQFRVLRRDQNIDTTGRARNTPMAVVGALGVVTATSPNELVRLPEEQHQSKSIEITTTFPLHGPAEGLSPDLILWHGDTFVVTLLDDWSNYGPGFIHVVCSSMDGVDLPPEATGVGQEAAMKPTLFDETVQLVGEYQLPTKGIFNQRLLFIGAGTILAPTNGQICTDTGNFTTAQSSEQFAALALTCLGGGQWVVTSKSGDWTFAYVIPPTPIAVTTIETIQLVDTYQLPDGTANTQLLIVGGPGTVLAPPDGNISNTIGSFTSAMASQPLSALLLAGMGEGQWVVVSQSGGWAFS